MKASGDKNGLSKLLERPQKNEQATYLDLIEAAVHAYSFTWQRILLKADKTTQYPVKTDINHSHEEENVNLGKPISRMDRRTIE